jgi:hypothetical protein
MYKGSYGWNGVEGMVRVYIMFFRNFVLYGDVGVIRVCIVGANGRMCLFFG